MCTADDFFFFFFFLEWGGGGGGGGSEKIGLNLWQESSFVSILAEKCSKILFGVLRPSLRCKDHI